MEYFFAEANTGLKVADWLGTQEAREALESAVEQVRQVEVDLQKAREVSREALALPVTVF